MRYGELLRAARKRSGKTLRELAEALGFSVPYISDVERGARLPLSDGDTMRAASFLGCDVHALDAASLEERGTARLIIAGTSTKHRTVGAALARRWSSLSADQLDAILAVVRGSK